MTCSIIALDLSAKLNTNLKALITVPSLHGLLCPPTSHRNFVRKRLLTHYAAVMTESLLPPFWTLYMTTVITV
jgi:hypothetical protein